jgi:hypothetical protein
MVGTIIHAARQKVYPSVPLLSATAPNRETAIANSRYHFWPLSRPVELVDWLRQRLVRRKSSRTSDTPRGLQPYGFSVRPRR